MKKGLAIWHYPHRTLNENVAFFASHGFKSVSVLGDHFAAALDDESFADIIRKTGVVLTVHGKLPASHDNDVVKAFEETIIKMGKWQEIYGLVSILSFDVPQDIRDNITPYVDFVLANVPGCRIAIEDFGLTDAERKQIEHLKSDDRFGYLIDIGHMYIRLRGKNERNVTLFQNSPDECHITENPCLDDFKKAFSSKEFPIFEIHLHNNDGANDLHYFYEDGTLDMKMIAQLLKDIKFGGVLTNESAPGFRFKCCGSDADEGILRTDAFWKECCSAII